MKKLIYIFFTILLITSCKQECSPTYYWEFTDDDLSFILLKKTDLNNNRPLVYSKTDTVLYLLNNSDTIYAERYRSANNILINNYRSDCLNSYYVSGTYKLEFIDTCFIRNSFMKIERNDDCSKLHKYLQVDYINEDLDDYCFEKDCDYPCLNGFEIRDISFNGENYDSYYFNVNSNKYYFIKGIGIVDIYDKNSNDFLRLIE